jgi:hypothetical protein
MIKAAESKLSPRPITETEEQTTVALCPAVVEEFIAEARRYFAQ